MACACPMPELPELLQKVVVAAVITIATDAKLVQELGIVTILLRVLRVLRVSYRPCESSCCNTLNGLRSAWRATLQTCVGQQAKALTPLHNSHNQRVHKVMSAEDCCIWLAHSTLEGSQSGHATRSFVLLVIASGLKLQAVG